MARDEETPERKTGVAGWRESQGAGSSRAASAGARQRKSVVDRRRRQVLLVILALLCVACVVCFVPIQQTITRGLWLKGGTAVSFDVSKQDGSEPTSQDMSATASTLAKRINELGISEVEVRPEGTSGMVVSLPWYIDATSVAESVCGTGKIEFARVDEIGDADALAKINAGTSGVALADGTYTSFMDGSAVKSATVTEVSAGSYAVSLFFTDEGTKTFADVTRELAADGGQIAIVMDGKVLTAPGVSEAIDGGQVTISGQFSAEEANALKAVVDTGEVPVKLSLTGSQEIGPMLGGEIILGLIIAIAVVFVGVSVFAFRSFGKLGLIVTGAMAVFAITLLGTMALFSRLRMFALTMPGVTGGILASLTVTVFAWLLIGSFRNKIIAGGSVKSAASTVVSDTFGPVALPCAVAVVAAIVMLFLPMPVVRHFGRLFLFGVGCGVISLFWFAVTTLRLLAMGSIQADPTAWGLPASSEVATSKEANSGKDS